MAVDPAALAVTMARALRRVGVPASPDATAAFAAALGHVGLDRAEHVYWAGRATLVQHHEDIGEYDRVFAAVFGPPSSGLAEVARPPEAVTLLLDGEGQPPAAVTGDLLDGAVLSVRWSDQEVLADKDFAACTPAELAELNRLVASVRVVGARRPSRRSRPTRRARGPIDLRATTRRALRTAGEPMRTAHRRRGTRPRRVVLLCDVSGSMEAYARALVRFGHAAVAGRTPVEVFTLGTRCTRITRELSSRDPDAALRAAALAVEDWSGGTRLGDGLRVFNDRWGVRGMARGATVVILSDGWDRGDPTILGAQVERLGRVAHRVVWVNPLKAQPGFAPLAQGMAAALPHVDELVEGHSLHALEALAEVLGR
jgi:uncharacterized protein with von Willebrand factor type A (vWA) domain